jgi:chromosome segregation ATPase
MTNMVHDTASTIKTLRETLHAWQECHRDHQEADERWRKLDADLKACKQHATTVAAADTTLKNAEARAAFVAFHLRDSCGQLLIAEANAAETRRTAAAELERLTEQLKTLRAILHHETAQVEAQTAATLADDLF